MFELFAANTPNGHRAAIFLEEMELDYKLHVLDVFKGEAALPDFLKINPLGRVPVLIDKTQSPEQVITQSWAIGYHLAEKTGKFVPPDSSEKLKMLEWLFHLGTDVTMVHSTLNAVSNFVPEKTASTIQFFEDRLIKIFAKLDEHLSRQDYFCGQITVADLAFYPVFNFRRALIANQASFNGLRKWGERMDSRPRIRRGIDAIAK